jgi:sulfopyruvate decarboxylase TPP-binding subunit
MAFYPWLQGGVKRNVEMDFGEDTAASGWQKHIIPTLKGFDIRHVVYVPDAGHSIAIRAAEEDREITALPLTTEEEGIGYLAGAWLGGDRGALLLQSSGVGNCINTLSLCASARFPLLMLVTMRGDWAEFNGWQNPMGQAVEKSLELIGVRCWRADREDDVIPLLHGAATMAFQGDAACALILGQRLIGEKKWSK